MIHIELSTAADRHTHVATAVFNGKTITVRENKKSVIPPMCRALVDAGADLCNYMMISRGEMPILVRPVQLKSWTGIDYHDGDTSGLRKSRYEPRPEGFGTRETA